jgi:hypothetical protein
LLFVLSIEFLNTAGWQYPSDRHEAIRITKDLIGRVFFALALAARGGRSAAGYVGLLIGAWGQRRSETPTSTANLSGRTSHATLGPFRLFASDPGLSEAWWWLGIPLIAIFRSELP